MTEGAEADRPRRRRKPSDPLGSFRAPGHCLDCTRPRLESYRKPGPQLERAPGPSLKTIYVKRRSPRLERNCSVVTRARSRGTEAVIRRSARSPHRAAHFTLPAVRPPTRWRSIIAKSTTTGTIAMTEAAKSWFQCWTYAVTYEVMPTVN